MDLSDIPEKVIPKFEQYVDKSPNPTGCWNWTGFLDKTGSPIIRVGTHSASSFTRYGPRRISLQLIGKALDPKAHVLPKCNNQLCVNPTHLVHGNESRFW